MKTIRIIEFVVGWDWKVGQIVEVSETNANTLIAAGKAELIKVKKNAPIKDASNI
jgi:hypothetical protein